MGAIELRVIFKLQAEINQKALDGRAMEIPTRALLGVIA